MNKLIFTISFITLVQTNFVFAANEIVDVRRNITLSDDEIPAKDFYIRLSESAGSFKKNLVIKATRKINVKDTSLKSVGEFRTVVGLLKIIHVEGSVAVAREFKLIPRTDQPMLEQIGIMTGDEIDLSESFIDTTKPLDPKKKVAEATPTQSPENTEAREPATADKAPTVPESIKPNSIVRDI
jgi:hypothetical protein